MWWWAWGAAGAFVFAQGALVFALWNTGATRPGRGRATAEFFGALMTGAIFAQGFTPTLQGWAAQAFQADGVAVALTIGWASNYIWPKLLHWLGAKVDRMDPKGPSV